MIEKKITLTKDAFHRISHSYLTESKQPAKYQLPPSLFYLLTHSNNKFYYRLTTDLPILSGHMSIVPINDFFYAEYQDFFIKKDLFLHLAYDKHHLEFNFPLEGHIELELGPKYMHSKGENDLFSLATFTQTNASIAIPQGQRIRQLSFNLYRPLPPQQLPFLHPLNRSSCHLYKVSGEHPPFESIINQLTHQIKNSSIEQTEFHDLFCDLITETNYHISKNKAYHSCISRTDYQTIKKVRRLIDQTYLADWRLDEIAKQVAENDYKLKKGYRQVYGQTIFETIRQKRMQHAVTLFHTNRYTLEEIAYLCGYHDYTGFYKSFKRHFNCSPTEWLKSV